MRFPHALVLRRSVAFGAESALLERAASERVGLRAATVTTT